MGQTVFCHTALHIYFVLIQRRVCILTEQGMRGKKSLSERETNARGVCEMV